MLGEIKCSGVAGRLSRALLEEFSEQRIEGGEECAMRLSRGQCSEKKDEQEKDPKEMYALPAQGQVREPMCLGQSEGKSGRRQHKVVMSPESHNKAYGPL